MSNENITMGIYIEKDLIDSIAAFLRKWVRMKKAKKIIIKQVTYCYIGKDKDFNSFLKSVIHDYLSDSVSPVSGASVIQKVENKTA